MYDWERDRLWHSRNTMKYNEFHKDGQKELPTVLKNVGEYHQRAAKGVQFFPIDFIEYMF